TPEVMPVIAVAMPEGRGRLCAPARQITSVAPTVTTPMMMRSGRSSSTVSTQLPSIAKGIAQATSDSTLRRSMSSQSARRVCRFETKVSARMTGTTRDGAMTVAIRGTANIEKPKPLKPRNRPATATIRLRRTTSAREGMRGRPAGKRAILPHPAAGGSGVLPGERQRRFLEHVGELQRLAPAPRDRRGAMHGAQEMAGDRADGIAVAVDVHRGDDPLLERLGHAQAVER